MIAAPDWRDRAEGYILVACHDCELLAGWEGFVAMLAVVEHLQAVGFTALLKKEYNPANPIPARR